MTTDFNDLRQRAAVLVSDFAARDAMFEELRQAFHMEWKDKPAGDWIKETLSPTAFNSVIGGTRLMTSTEPSVSVPFDENDGGSRTVSEKIERAAKAMWNAAGRVQQRPAHYDLVLCGLLFAEMGASVTATADLVRWANESKDTRNIRRMESIAARAPYLFKVYNPMTFYPETDDLGLAGTLRRTLTTWGRVLDEWGSLAADSVRFPNAAIVGAGDRQRAVTLCDWYDWEQRCVWIENTEGAILHEDHGLEFMPLVHGITEGSTIFGKPEQQRFPMLYPMIKSGMWRRENLSLTMMYSLIFALGANPMLVYEAEADSQLVIDRSLPANVLRVRPGEKVYPLAEKVLDQSQTYGYDVARSVNEESTISRQALGAPPKDALAFSAINLLVQSGRLPLMGTKQMAGKVVAELMTQAVRWWGKNKGEGAKLYDSRGAAIELRQAEVPDYFAINVSLEPDLPTDKLNLANVADRLVSSKLASREWVRQNILSIGQSDQMDKAIWMEERVMAELTERLKALAAQNDMTLQQLAARAMQPQGQPPAGPGAGGPPPDQAGAYPPGGVGEGAPLAASLPPRSGPGAMPMQGA